MLYTYKMEAVQASIIVHQTAAGHANNFSQQSDIITF